MSNLITGKTDSEVIEDLKAQLSDANREIEQLINAFKDQNPLSQATKLAERIVELKEQVAEQIKDTELYVSLLDKAKDKLREVRLERGHLRHRFETIKGWCRAKGTLESKYVLELLEKPLPELVESPEGS